jgi:hypothetical protein
MGNDRWLFADAPQTRLPVMAVGKPDQLGYSHLPMGKHDRRNSMKMKRRKAQVKKLARLKRRPAVTKKATTAAAPAKAKRSKPAAAATDTSSS